MNKDKGRLYYGNGFRVIRLNPDGSVHHYGWKARVIYCLICVFGVMASSAYSISRQGEHLIAANMDGYMEGYNDGMKDGTQIDQRHPRE